MRKYAIDIPKEEWERYLNQAKETLAKGNWTEGTLNHERNRLNFEDKLREMDFKDFKLPEDITPEQLARFNLDMDEYTQAAVMANRYLRGMLLDRASWKVNPVPPHIKEVDKSE